MVVLPSIVVYGIDMADYYVPIAILGLCVIVYAISRVGRAKNTAIARDVTGTLRTAVDKEFSSCTHLLYRSTNASFVYHATGRVNTTGMAVHINLQSRHDALTRLGLYLLDSRDTVVIELPLHCATPAHVMALVNTSEIDAFFKVNRDVTRTCNALSIPELAKPDDIRHSFVAFGSSSNLRSHYLTPAVFDEVKALGPWLMSAHVTDSSLRGGASSVLRVEAGLPKGEARDTVVLAAFKLAMLMLDRVPDVKISKKEITKRKKEIEKVTRKARHETLMEKAQQRKADKLKKEEEAAMKLTGIEQKKAEERRTKMEQRRQERKMTKRL